MTAVASALLLVVALMFAASATHKVRAIVAHRAELEPLLASSAFRRRHATLVLAAVAALEIVLIPSVLVLPAVGLTMTALLLAYYSVEVARLPADSSCNCFGSLVPAKKTAALIRNLSLIAISLIGSIMFASGAVSRVFDAQAVAQALGVVAAVGGFAVARYLFPDEGVSSREGSFG